MVELVDYISARRYLESTLALADKSEVVALVSNVLLALGPLSLQDGHIEEAAQIGQRLLDIIERSGDDSPVMQGRRAYALHALELSEAFSDAENRDFAWHVLAARR